MSEQVSGKNTLPEVQAASKGAPRRTQTHPLPLNCSSRSLIRALRKVVGPGAGQAIMFHLRPSGFRDPASLNNRLRSMFGPGAVICEGAALTELSDMMRRGLYSLDFTIAARKADNVLCGEVRGATIGGPEEAKHANSPAKRVVHSLPG